MVTVEKIIAELKIGGYLDAAEYIERQFATINRTAEFGYMKAFIVEGDFSDERCPERPAPGALDSVLPPSQSRCGHGGV